jgi:hypothetical protein
VRRQHRQAPLGQRRHRRASVHPPTRPVLVGDRLDGLVGLAPLAGLQRDRVGRITCREGIGTTRRPALGIARARVAYEPGTGCQR